MRSGLPMRIGFTPAKLPRSTSAAAAAGDVMLPASESESDLVACARLDWGWQRRLGCGNRSIRVP